MALNGSSLLDQLAPVDRSQTTSVRNPRTERSPADTPDDKETGSFDAALRDSVAEKPEPRRSEARDRADETAVPDAAPRDAPASDAARAADAEGTSGTAEPTTDRGATPADEAAQPVDPGQTGQPSGTEATGETLSDGSATGTAPILGDLLKAAGIDADAGIILDGKGGTARDGLAALLADPAAATLSGTEARPAVLAGAGASGAATDAAAAASRTQIAPPPAGSVPPGAGHPSAVVTPDLAAAVQTALAQNGLSPDAARPGSGPAQPSATSSNGSLEPALSPDAAKALAQRPVPGFENAIVRGTRVEGGATGSPAAAADGALVALDADGLDGDALDGDILLSSRSRLSADAGTGSTPTQATASSASLAGLQGAVSRAAGRFAALVGQAGAGPAEAADVPAGLGGLEAAGAVKPDTAFATLTPQAVSEAAGPRTLSPAIVSAAGAIARGAAAGENRFSIRLDPPELGRVDVRLKIGDDGVARAHLIVERSETLDLFLRDQRNLERALEQAGVKTDATSLQFSLKGDGDGQAGFAAADGDDGSGGPTASGDSSDAAEAAASDSSDRNHDGVLNITI